MTSSHTHHYQWEKVGLLVSAFVSHPCGLQGYGTLISGFHDYCVRLNEDGPKSAHELKLPNALIAWRFKTTAFIKSIWTSHLQPNYSSENTPSSRTYRYLYKRNQ